MSRDKATFILRYDGILEISDEFVPKYIGGKSRPLQVSLNTNFENLKIYITQLLNYDITKYTVNIICRFPMGQSYTVTHITDDASVDVLLDIGVRENLTLYVEIVALDYQSDRSIPDATQYNYVEDSQIEHFNMNIQTVDTNQPSSSTQPPRNRVEIEQTLEPVGEGYETMDSESSEDCSDREDLGENANTINIDDANNFTGHELLRRHIVEQQNQQINEVSEQMISSNEYIQYYTTTQEWNDNINFDDTLDTITRFEDCFIPMELAKNMFFPDKSALKFAIKGWSIVNNVEYQVVKSDQSILTIICIHRNHPHNPCQWRLHASSRKRLGGAWSISNISSPHTCSHPILLGGHRQCTSSFVCYFILPTIRKEFDLKPKEIVGRIEAKFNVKISYVKAWDARRKAIQIIFGSWEESYRSLLRFLEAICLVMPGTVYRIQVSQSSRFSRVFWAFGPSISGWTYCRPVLSMDGTFLLGKFRGTLLTAIGVDANNGLFPLAFGIVESECNESWFWFLENLYEAIPSVACRSDLCIISDRHSGLVRGCREIFPHAAHRHCLRHLRENFKKALRSMGIGDVDTMCHKMYLAGCSDDKRIYDRCMNDIKNVKVEAHNWLVERDTMKWTLVHDGGFRYGTMTTNAAECFNGVLKRARGLPIQALIGSIYYNLVGLFYRRLNDANNLLRANESPFVPKIKQKLCKLENEARRFPIPTCINIREFEVFDMACRSYRVEILNSGDAICSCNRPQTYHMPCSHVIAAMGIRRMNHLTFVSPFYSTVSYKETYITEFHVIPDKVSWPEFNQSTGIIELLPPIVRRRAGRPKVSRYRNTMDETRTQSTRICSICRTQGHNRSTCPQNPKNYR